MKNIIYVHGIGGQNSSKFEHLKNHFSSDKYTTIKLEQDLDSPLNSYELLGDAISIIQNRGESVFLIGSSRGGLYSFIASSEFSVPCLLINPALDAKRMTLEKFVELGLDNPERHYKEMLELYSRYKKLEIKPELINLFLSENDVVVDHKFTLRMLNNSNSIYINQDSHRFESFSTLLDKVENIIKPYQNNSVS